MKIEVTTRIGWDHYAFNKSNEDSIFDNCDDINDARTGSVEKVTAYLKRLKKEVIRRWPAANLERKTLAWEGQNGGWFYEGQDALDVINAEIELFAGAQARADQVRAEGGDADEIEDAIYNA